MNIEVIGRVVCDITAQGFKCGLSKVWEKNLTYQSIVSQLCQASIFFVCTSICISICDSGGSIN